ncbi:hypothetical protein D9757_013996 [Collybiopsis confluens]|uniref:C2H2-type domain-containing protein n=1 Tax=Collybiopsis confluens TaxID=2823264 RepID=A0A8H5FU66_9AGAR|nr:hypothetical protein D9757_013996 [Collybiopsis confluens]
MPTEFLCPVPTCYKSFSKPGDRQRHIKTKEDDAHREEYQRQMKAQAARITSTINRLNHIADKTTTHHSAASIGSAGRQEVLHPQLQHSHSNDHMDIDDLNVDDERPVVGFMNVDKDSVHSESCEDSSDGDLDDHYNDCRESEDSDIEDCASLCSLSDDDSEDESMHDTIFQAKPESHDDENVKQLQESYYRGMATLMEGMTSTSNQFDFLPPPHKSASPAMSDLDDNDSDLESGFDNSDSSSISMDPTSTSSKDPPGSSIEEASGPNAYRNMARTLVENEDEEPRTWWWHPTAEKSGLQGQDEYYPFATRLDWEVAEWAVKEKISQKSFDQLLQIPQIQEKLGLSYANSRAMLKYIDAIPDRCGVWYTKELSFRDSPDDHFTVHHRDPIQAIKALWGDPAFAEHLIYKPGKLFYGKKQTENMRMFSEMWTAGFWNAVQGAIPDGGTVCPIIIASDKTNLTRFSGNKSAYPVYLTIDSIRWLGTTDNYNTEAFERHHIDMAKKGWEASNKRDHFPQMTQWLARQEKILSYNFYRNWFDSTEEALTQNISDLNDRVDSNVDILGQNQDAEEYTLKPNTGLVKMGNKKTEYSNVQAPALTGSAANPHVQHQLQSHIQIVRHPHEPKKSLSRISDSHNAPGFVLALKHYLNSYLPASQQASKSDVLQASLPFTSLNVWHQFKFTPANLLYDDSDVPKEIVKAVPATKKTPVIRYDTVIAMKENTSKTTWAPSNSAVGNLLGINGSAGDDSTQRIPVFGEGRDLPPTIDGSRVEYGFLPGLMRWEPAELEVAPDLTTPSIPTPLKTSACVYQALPGCSPIVVR